MLTGRAPKRFEQMRLYRDTKPAAPHHVVANLRLIRRGVNYNAITQLLVQRAADAGLDGLLEFRCEFSETGSVRYGDFQAWTTCQARGFVWGEASTPAAPTPPSR